MLRTTSNVRAFCAPPPHPACSCRSANVLLQRFPCAVSPSSPKQLRTALRHMRHLCSADRSPDAAYGDIPTQAGAEDLQEYRQLKEAINATVRKFSAFLTGYLLLVTTSDVAVCAAMGSLAGYGYLQLLMRDVDSFREDDPVAAAFLMQDDSRLELAALRSVRKIGAAYRAALRPRLLVLVGLAAAAGSYNTVAVEPLNAAQTAALFAGFLSYKSGLVGQIWDATRPKFNPDDLLKPPRPVLPAFETEADRLAAIDAAVEEWHLKMKNR